MSSNLKVLVADDNRDHVQLITEILNQELKAEVEGVTKGEECLEKVKKNRYDLLLLDYLFPEISGLDILKEIVEKDYDLPVIMITGHGSEKVAVEAMKAGAIDYIVKSEDGFQSLPFVAKKAIEKDQLRKRLRQSEEKFQNLFESANDAIIYLDRAGRILEVNKQAVEVFGGSKPEMLGKHFTRLGVFPPGEIPALLNNFADILAGKEATVGVCFKNKKGQEIALECSASLMKADVKVSGVMVIARDITERKRMENALITKERIARERARLLTDLRNLDQIEEILTRVCEAVCDSGMFERAVMTLHDADKQIIHLGQAGLSTDVVERARHAPPMDENLKAQITSEEFRISGSFFIPTEAGLDFSQTTRYVPQEQGNSKAGDWQPNDELFVPLRDFSGKIMGYLSVDTPTDGHRPDMGTIEALEMLVEAAASRIREVKAQKALSESEERFKRFASAITDVIYRYDPINTQYDFVSPSFELQTGYSLDEIKSDPSAVIRRITHPDDVERVFSEVKAHVEKGPGAGPFCAEYRVIRKDREVIWVSDRKDVEFASDGKVYRINGVVRDITERKKAEEALRNSENLLSSIIDQSPFSTWIADANGTNIRQNAACRKLFGIDRDDQTVGKYNLFLDPVPQEQGFMDSIEKVFKEGKTARFTIDYDFSKVKHVDVPGATHTLLDVTIFPIKDAQGNVINAVVQHQDITERKRAEERLKRERDFSQSILETANSMIVCLDGYAKITVFNQECERVTGYRREEVLGKAWPELFLPPDHCHAELKSFAKWVRAHPIDQYEGPIVTKSGEIRTILWSNTSILGSDEVEVVAIAIGYDITERKRVEEALRESEEKHRTLVENASDFIFMIDKKEEVLSVNKSAAMLFRKEPNEIIGKSILDLFPSETALGFSISLKEVFLTGTNRLSETTMMAGGEEKWISANLSPVRNLEGKVVAVMGITRDITERKKMEAQLIQAERLTAVGTLAYGIAHEFNNILAGILGNAEFGLITNDPKEVKECFQIIQENCERAKSITNNLLAFSRQRETKKQKADVTDAVESVLGLVERELEKQNVKVVRKFNPIPEIICDLGELSEVALNLITNARDAMQPKGGTLTIEIGKKKDNIEMVFTDTGGGIPDSIKGRIFEPFVTTKGALGQSEIQGTGLGLFLSYGIISRYHGKIEVKSEMGKGSQFTIKIPISKNQTVPISVDVEEDESPEVPQNLNILLVDDEKPILSFIKKFMEAKGHSVITSASGKKGLQLFKNRAFDLVLSDITMPDMDGIKLISRLKRLDPNVKLIALTGHLAEEKLDSAKKAGADYILTKPFKNEDLYKAIGRVVNG